MHCKQCGGLLEERSVKEHGRNELRAVCTICSTVHYDNPVPVVMCLVHKTLKGQPCVLMTRNVDSPPTMPLVFVAGFLEKTDSSPSLAMSRELGEEIGLSVDESRLELLGVRVFKRMNQLTILYTVSLREDEEPVMNKDELAEMKWIPLSKINRTLLSWKDGPADLVRAWVEKMLQKPKL